MNDNTVLYAPGACYWLTIFSCVYYVKHCATKNCATSLVLLLLPYASMCNNEIPQKSSGSWITPWNQVYNRAD